MPQHTPESCEERLCNSEHECAVFLHRCCELRAISRDVRTRELVSDHLAEKLHHMGDNTKELQSYNVRVENKIRVLRKALVAEREAHAQLLEMYEQDKLKHQTEVKQLRKELDAAVMENSRGER
ncbi:hypothetical protein DICA4_B03906 [Diutina catenulata]